LQEIDFEGFSPKVSGWGEFVERLACETGKIETEERDLLGRGSQSTGPALTITERPV